MKPPSSQTKSTWRVALVVANVAVLVAMLIPLAAGQIRTFSEFLRSWAYALIFANLTTVLGVFLIGAALEQRARHRRNIFPVAIAGLIIVVPLGCLAAPFLLVALHLGPAVDFWPDYWRTLKGVTPLALVFGLGAFVYASLVTRLELAEQKLREKELAEERTKKLAAETRLRSLESWIHPHFLFNTLNSISALIAVDPARAEQIVGRFARLLRTSLDSSNHSLIPLEQELAFVESYVDIERVRLGDRLRGGIEVAAEFSLVPVPPMSIQTLVENAIKHGINPRPSGGELLVTAREADGRVTISVRDSGPGFDLASIPAEHGLDKLVQRLDALYNGKAGIHVSRHEEFCLVEMSLPRP